MLKNVEEERLFFTTSLAEGMRDAEVVFIAVQTPMSESGEADLQYVMKVGEEIGELLDGYKVIVTKSTVPVGTAAPWRKVITAQSEPGRRRSTWPATPSSCARARASRTSCARTAWSSASRPSAPEKLLREIYRPLFLLDTPIVKTGIETAELIKYASNSFLAVKISFINEIARAGRDAWAPTSSTWPRPWAWTSASARSSCTPGLGFGGSCLPKDTNAIVHIAEEAGADMSIVRAAIGVNADLPGPRHGQGRSA